MSDRPSLRERLERFAPSDDDYSVVEFADLVRDVLDIAEGRDRLEAALRDAVEEIESEEKRWLEWWARGGKGAFVWKREAVQSARKVLDAH